MEVTGLVDKDVTAVRVGVDGTVDKVDVEGTGSAEVDVDGTGRIGVEDTGAGEVDMD